MPIVETAARRVAGLLGRNSSLIRSLRPAYESLLGQMHGGNGIPWRMNGVTYRIDPKERPRFGQNYETETAAFLARRIQPGMTCYDVGANVGAYVLQLAHWSAPHGVIVAFEPNAGAREVLARHIQWNCILERVRVVPAAVSSEPGEQILYAEGASGMSRLAQANNAHASTAREDRVAVTTIDRYCALGNPPPDVILLDIEGFEIEALRGAQQTIRAHKPIIVVEMHPNVWESADTTLAQTEELLSALRLRAVPLSGQQSPLNEHGQVWLEPY
jgi:FkbM family methyltransferase